jgi:ABC-type transport system involved in Fe-S cluster assembly fused permease/ATPase subunit
MVTCVIFYINFKVIIIKLTINIRNNKKNKNKINKMKRKSVEQCFATEKDTLKEETIINS